MHKMDCSDKRNEAIDVDDDNAINKDGKKIPVVMLKLRLLVLRQN